MEKVVDAPVFDEDFKAVSLSVMFSLLGTGDVTPQQQLLKTQCGWIGSTNMSGRPTCSNVPKTVGDQMQFVDRIACALMIARTKNAQHGQLSTAALH